MYYEKLNQGCIAGWRIRQNHLWRFEGGGFQGRGMKQEEAIAAQQKENELMATAQHKAAAAAALAQGHPSVKVSMSGGLDGAPASKRPRKSNGQARRKNAAVALGDKKDEYDYNAYAAHAAAAAAAAAQPYAALEEPAAAGPSSGIIDPALSAAVEASAAAAAASEAAAAAEQSAAPEGDDIMMQQAMAAANAAAAAAGQMDELEMGIQLPIEMQMHTGTHDDDSYAGYEGQGYSYGTSGTEYDAGTYQEGQ
jgi:hypothetical protein